MNSAKMMRNTLMLSAAILMAVTGCRKDKDETDTDTGSALDNSFAEAIAGRISNKCFEFLDAPVQTLGSLNMPAVPLNMGLEREMLPNGDKVTQVLNDLLDY